jgi:hypothetical protein
MKLSARCVEPLHFQGIDRRRSVKALRMAGMAILVLTAVGCGSNPPTQPALFTSEEGKFKVAFPATPGQMPIKNGKEFVLGPPDGSGDGWGVTYWELPDAAGIDEAKLEQALDAAPIRLMMQFAGGGGKVLSNERIKLGKHQGTEAKLLLTDQRDLCLRARIFFIGGRYYEVSVRGTKKFIESPEAVRFLDSFAVIE